MPGRHRPLPTSVGGTSSGPRERLGRSSATRGAATAGLTGGMQLSRRSRADRCRQMARLQHQQAEISRQIAELYTEEADELYGSDMEG